MSIASVLRVIVLVAIAGPVFGDERPLVTYLETDRQSASSGAVLVGPCALAHTAQMLPLDAQGRLVGKDNAANQARMVLSNLENALQAAGSGMDRLIRVHAYAASSEAMDACRPIFAERFAKSARPAVTWTIGKLPLAGALVTADAVAAVPQHAGRQVAHVHVTGRAAALRPSSPPKADVSILPQGRVAYISGQAAADETLAEATRETLVGLQKTLEHLGLDRSHVVQVKTFLQPMSQVEQADQEIAAFFQGMTIPAVTHVEWTMRGPIEIELIAWAPEGTARMAQGRLSFITPSEMRPSPVFARVVVVDSKQVLYTSGITVEAGDNPEREVRQVFERLGKLLKMGGSDFLHLAKATYYVTDDDVSQMLTKVRPDFYNPERPPAASKAAVRGAGVGGGRIVVDLIGVPSGEDGLKP